MQISGQVPVIPVMTPSASAAKAPSSAISPEALKSTLAPAQPLEALAPAGTATESPLVYTRSSVVSRAGGVSATDSDEARVSGGESDREAPITPDERAQQVPGDDGQASQGSSQEDDTAGREADRPPAGPRDTAGPDEAELAEIRALSQRDRQVRQHEQAHAAVGGSLAGAPSFDHERGPDGRQYAVSGEVPIDASPVPGDPEATLRKMEQVRRAALAPADPSPQDRMVAARATQLMLQARAELLAQQREARLEQARNDDESAGDRQARQNRTALDTYNQLARAGEAEPAGRVPDLSEVIA